MYESQLFLREDVNDFTDHNYEFIGFVKYNHLQ